MANERDPRLEELKHEMRLLMKKTNQRLLRLEKNGLSSSPGYKAMQDITGMDRPRFGVKGKTFEQLQDDRQRMQNFLDYKSSTVKGAKQLLQQYARQMRVPFANDMNKLVEESSKFFRLSNYVKQYIRNTSQERAISSDEVFMGISRAVEAGEVNLNEINFDNFDLSMEQMEEIVRKAGGDTTTNSLFDELEKMDEVKYSSRVRVKGFDPNDF